MLLPGRIRLFLGRLYQTSGNFPLCFVLFCFLKLQTVFSHNQNGKIYDIYSVEWNGTDFLVSGNSFSNRAFPTLNLYENNYYIFENNSSIPSQLSIGDNNYTNYTKSDVWNNGANSTGEYLLFYPDQNTSRTLYYFNSDKNQTVGEINIFGSDSLFLHPQVDKASFKFGQSVSINEWNQTIFGSPGEAGFDDGAIHVFNPESNGTYSYHQKISPPISGQLGQFGHSLTSVDEFVFVGSPDSFTYSGSVDIFERESNGSYRPYESLNAYSQMLDSFGWDLSAYGQNLAVSSVQAINNGTGKVSMFVHDGNNWILSTSLTANDKQINDEFGFSIKLSENRLLVGAPKADVSGTNSGAAYIFDKNSSGWFQSFKLSPSNLSAGDEFGYSVALGTNIAFVGARQKDGNATNAGSVHVFHFDGVSWVEVSQIYPPFVSANQYFSSDLVLHENILAVSSPMLSEGYVYLYRVENNGTKITLLSSLDFSETNSTDQSQLSIGLSDNFFVAGIPGESSHANVGGGAIAFFNDAWQREIRPIIAPIIEHNSSSINLEINEDSGQFFYDFNGSHPFDSNLTWSFSQIPEGNFTFDINSSSGLFSYHTKSDFNGVHSFVLVLSNGKKSDYLDFNLSVKSIQDYPKFVTSNLISVMEGEDFNQSIIVSDVDGGVLSISFDHPQLGCDMVGHNLVGRPNIGTARAQPYSVTLTVIDEDGNPTSKQFNLKILEPNNPPRIWVDGNANIEALDFNLTEDFNLPEDFNGSNWFSFMPVFDFNDSDLDQLELTTSIPPLHGNVFFPATSNPRHRVLYVPDGNYSGSDSFTIKLNDNLIDDRNRSDKLKFNINLSPVHDPPKIVSVPPGNIALEGVEYNYPIIIDDPDANESLTITVSNLALPPKDWLKFNNVTRILSGTPTWENYEERGSRIILINAVDQSGLSNSQAFELSVKPLNNPPVITLGSTFSVQLKEDTELLSWNNLGVAATDDDGTIGELIWGIQSPPSNGEANFTTLSSTPTTLYYRPDANFTGNDSFELKVFDSNDSNASDVLLVNVFVEPVEDFPIFVSSTSGIAVSGHEFVYDINVSDADAQDTLQIKPLGNLPSWLEGNFTDYGNGTAKLWGTPLTQDVSNFILILEARDSTNRTALQQTNIQVIATNTNPIITQGDNITFISDEDTNWDGNSLISAFDADGQFLEWSVSMQAINGDVNCSGLGNSPNILTYKPKADFSGSDSFVLRVSDGVSFDEITITIEVRNVEDSPVFTSFPTDEIVIDGSPFLKLISFKDVDTLLDANLTFNIPNWLTLDDSNFSGGQVNLIGTPSVANEGNYSLSFTLTDRTNLSVSSTFEIEVRVLNYPPMINSGNLYETVSMIEDDPSSWQSPVMFAEDNETNVQDLIWSVSAIPQYGNATINSNGSGLTYIPDANYSGADSFVVKVEDLGGDENSSSKFDLITIKLDVKAVNDKPIFISQPKSDRNGSITWNDESEYEYKIITYDSDWDWQTLSLSLENPNSLPDWLEFYNEGNGTGSLKGNPMVKDIGNYELELQINDSNGSKNTQKFQLEIRVDNYPPVFQSNDGTQSTISEVLVYLDEDSNSSQPNGWSAPNNYLAVDPDSNHPNAEQLSWTLLEPSINGSQVVVSGSGSRPEIFSYIPALHFNGQETLKLSVNDGHRTSVLPVIINVRSIEDPPFFTSVINPFLTAQEGSLFTLNLTSSDADQSVRSIRVFGLPQGINSWIKLTNEDHINGSAILTGSVPIGQDGKKYPLAFVVSDSAGNFEVVNSVLSIQGQNIPPIINPETITIFFDANGTPNQNDLSLLYASDKDGDLLHWSLSSDGLPSNGQAIVTGNGNQPSISFLITDSNFTTDSFTVRVSDGINYDEVLVNAKSVVSHDQFQVTSPNLESLAAGSKFHDYIFISEISENTSIAAELKNNPSWINIEKVNYNLFRLFGSVPLNIKGSFDVSMLFTENSVLKLEESFKIEILDKLGPQLSLINGNFEQLRLGMSFIDSGATVLAEGNSTSNQIISGSGDVNSSKKGFYKVLYQSSDSSGNIVGENKVVQVNDPLNTVDLKSVIPINLEGIEGVLPIDDNFIAWGKNPNLVESAFISKLELKTNQYTPNSSVNLSASKIEIDCLHILPDKSCLIAGIFRGNLSIGSNLIPAKGNHNLFVMKLTSQLSLEWIQSISGNSIIQNTKLAESMNGDILIAGTFEGIISKDSQSLNSGGGSDVFVWRISSLGNQQWLKSFGGVGNDDIQGLEVFDSGDVIIAGNVHKLLQPTYSYLLKFDSNGITLNSSSIKGEENNQIFMIERYKNKIFIVGDFDKNIEIGSKTLISNKSNSKFLTLIDENLIARWSIPLFTESKNSWVDLEVDYFGNPLISLNFEGNLSLPSNIGTLTSRGLKDLVIAKIDSLSGEFIWAEHIDSVKNVKMIDMIVDTFGETNLALNLESPLELEGIDIQSGRLFIGKLVPWTGVPEFESIENLNLVDAQYFQKEVRVLNQDFVRMQVVNSPDWINFHDNLNGTGVIGGIPDQNDLSDNKIEIVGYNANGGSSNFKLPFTLSSSSGIAAEDSFEDLRLISQFGENIAMGVMNKGTDNNYLLGGNFRNSVHFKDKLYNANYSLDGFILNLSSTGSILNSIHLACSDDVYVSSVLPIQSDKIFAFGYFKGRLSAGSLIAESKGGFDLFAMEAKLDGTILNLHSFGGSKNEFLSVAAIYGDKIVMGGVFENESTFNQKSFQSKGENDIFVIQASKQDISSINWVKVFGGDQQDSIKDLIISESGDIYLAGSFTGEMVFGGISLTSAGLTDGYIAQLSPNGGFSFAQSGGGAGADEVKSILFLKQNEILMGGEFREALNWGNRSLQSAGGEDCFIGVVTPNGDCLSLKKVGGSGNDNFSDFFKEDDRVVFLGAFSNQIQVGNDNLISKGQKDIFISSFDPIQQSFSNTLQIGGVGNDILYAGTSALLDNFFIFGMASGLVKQDGMVSIENERNSNFFISGIGSLTDIPKINTTPLSFIGESKFYEYYFTSGPWPSNDRLELVISKKPAWLNIILNQDGTGIIWGQAPNNLQGVSEKIEFSIVNSESIQVSQSFDLTIISKNEMFEVLGTPVLTCRQYSNYQSEFYLSGILKDNILINPSKIPSWMSFERVNSRMFKLHGQPGLGSVGKYQIEIIAHNVIENNKIYEESYKYILTVEPTIISNAVVTGLDDWKTNWFGYFINFDNLWNYHEELGWIFIESDLNSNNLWFWNRKWGWLWTNSTIWDSSIDEGFVFSSLENDWMYFRNRTQILPKTIFSYEKKKWFNYD